MIRCLFHSPRGFHSAVPSTIQSPPMKYVSYVGHILHRRSSEKSPRKYYPTTSRIIQCFNKTIAAHLTATRVTRIYWKKYGEDGTSAMFPLKYCTLSLVFKLKKLAASPGGFLSSPRRCSLFQRDLSGFVPHPSVIYFYIIRCISSSAYSPRRGRL